LKEFEEKDYYNLTNLKDKIANKLEDFINKENER